MLVALNMSDIAGARGLQVDCDQLLEELGGVPAVMCSAVTNGGTAELETALERLAAGQIAPPSQATGKKPEGPAGRFAEVDRILRACVTRPLSQSVWTERIDRVVVHPFAGPVLILAVLTLVFQAVFHWAAVPQDWIRSGVATLSAWAAQALPPGFFADLVSQGVLPGVGAVVVFLPQILLLFFFLMLLEDSGYMARAAYLADYWMGKAGLHGRALIPLLSSYACAIPGIMATRTIESPRDRLATILVAPLMTCSARIPVYTLLIGSFIPNREIDLGFGLGLGLQGLVMLGLYLAGVVAAIAVAWVLKKTALQGPRPSFILELPSYKWPQARSVVLGLWFRSQSFLTRAGTVILGLSVLIWVLSTYPKASPEVLAASGLPAIAHSVAGTVGAWLEPIFRPIGFDWRIVVALIPGMAAREVMVSALATVYAVEAGADPAQLSETLGKTLQQAWSLPTALSLLVWYVLACQCISTLAVTRRETGSWKWPAVMFGYMTGLAYVASWITYRVAVAVAAS